MTSDAQIAGDAAEWTSARGAAARVNILAGIAGALIVPVLVVPAMLLATKMASGGTRYLLGALWTAIFLTPLIALAVHRSQQEQRKSDALVENLASKLTMALADAQRENAERESQNTRQRFERRVTNALEMSEGEADVIDVVQRALSATVPHSSAELLLADNSHAHLVRMASASPTGEPPGCTVDSPDNCPAARRAQTQHFTESEELDSCPRLRGRPDGPSSAVCVPVSVMGRTVGVIHVTGEVHLPFPDEQVDNLETLANLTGGRIGLLRVMADTQLQASTDNLTGLLNRRSFEQQFGVRRSETKSMALAMADLDRFKELNDTYGHDSGDRALRLFSQTARDALRAGDLICRHGGEEFVLALADCTAERASKALNALRARLDAAITVAGLPKFTVSFGVVEARPQEDLPSMITRADLALFEAKRNGRDQVVIHTDDHDSSNEDRQRAT